MALFEELDYAQTDLGELILRRRATTRGVEIFEVKLDGQFLMSSLVNASEVALADLALAELDGTDLRVAVGGLGLGHTADAALGNPNVASLVVLEYLPEVIAWHTKNLVPLASRLVDNPRCTLVNANFFAWLQSSSDDRFHAILVDIDHSPDHLLVDTHGPFYDLQGLARLNDRLHRGGVFALWSGGPPADDFLQKLRSVFGRAEAHPVTFRNPLLDLEDTNTIYLARTIA